MIFQKAKMFLKLVRSTYYKRYFYIFKYFYIEITKVLKICSGTWRNKLIFRKNYISSFAK